MGGGAPEQRCHHRRPLVPQRGGGQLGQGCQPTPLTPMEAYGIPEIH
jgi:hypothetical protein